MFHNNFLAWNYRRWWKSWNSGEKTRGKWYPEWSFCTWNVIHRYLQYEGWIKSLQNNNSNQIKIEFSFALFIYRVLDVALPNKRNWNWCSDQTQGQTRRDDIDHLLNRMGVRCTSGRWGLWTHDGSCGCACTIDDGATVWRSRNLLSLVSSQGVLICYLCVW